VTCPVLRAVIDVGTNSVKLLVCDVHSGGARPIHEQSKQTRLGKGFYDTRVLLPDAIEQTAEAVALFSGIAREHGAESVRVVATSAARDALNREQLVKAITKIAGLETEIISGEQEAEFAFRGVATDPELRGRKLLILDVGGGSTEFIFGEGGHHTFRRSFELGTVRLLEKLRPNDPPSKHDLDQCRATLEGIFTSTIRPALGTALEDRSELIMVGTGGTATILARMEKQLATFSREEIERTVIQRERLPFWMEKLWGVSLDERKRIIGVPANRADIVPMGVAIYEAVMVHLDFPELFVSTRGLRFGALTADE